MGNLAIGYFNRVRSGVTITGGSWRAALPASNVASPERAAVARSTTAATADTKLNIDLGAAYTLRVIAFDAHNLSNAGQWLVKLGTSSGASDLYLGTLTNWLQATSVESTITEHGASKGRDFMAALVLSADISARYLTIEVSDSGNAAGYVEIGYVFAGPALIPAINAEYGAWSDGHTDLSTSSRARSGALWTDPVARYKSAQVSLGALTTAEAAIVHEQQRVLGTVGRVLFVPDIADADVTQRFGFIGRMSQLSALDHPQYARRGNAFTLEQG